MGLFPAGAGTRADSSLAQNVWLSPHANVTYVESVSSLFPGRFMFTT